MIRKNAGRLLLLFAAMGLAFTATAQDDDDFELVDLPDSIAEKVDGLTEKNYLSPLTTEHGHDQ